MGHAEDDLAQPVGGADVDREVEQRDQCLGALHREALRSDVLLLDELFEDRGLGEPLQDAELLLARRSRAILGALHVVLEPLADLCVFDMEELDPDRAAVRTAKSIEDLAERCLGAARDRIGHRAIQVALGESEIFGLEVGERRARGSKGVDARDQMSPRAETPEKRLRASRERGIRLRRGRGSSLRSRTCRGRARRRRARAVSVRLERFRERPRAAVESPRRKGRVQLRPRRESIRLADLAEILAPRRWYGRGISEIVGVKGLHEGKAQRIRTLFRRLGHVAPDVIHLRIVRC